MMKLGTQTGSVMNHLYSRMINGEPEVFLGMGATVLSWSDRSPGTITQIKTDKQGRTIIRVRGDNYKRVSGSVYDGSAVYEYSPDHLGGSTYFRRDENGWQQVRFSEKARRWVNIKSGQGVRIGQRDRYYDPHF